MPIADILHRKGSSVAKIKTVDTVDVAVAKLAEERIGALVVTDRWGAVAGMFSERDVIRALANHGAEALQFEVHELMTPDVTTCAPSDRIEAVMGIMTAHRIRHLPVMEGKRLVGLVSMGDLVKQRLLDKEQEANVLLDIARAHF